MVKVRSNVRNERLRALTNISDLSISKRPINSNWSRETIEECPEVRIEIVRTDDSPLRIGLELVETGRIIQESVSNSILNAGERKNNWIKSGNSY